MPAAPLPVLLVENHDDLRKMLVQLVGHTPGLAVWGFAASGPDALNQLAEADSSSLPALVVSDVAMPAMDGVALVAQIKARWPALPCLMHSALPACPYAELAEAAGAVGYVQKGTSSDLIDAIQRTVPSV